MPSLAPNSITVAGVELLLDPLGVCVEVAHEPGDGAGRERVISEQDLGIDRVDDLNKSAAVADADQQRIPLLRRDLLGTTQEPAGQRQPAEIEERSYGCLGAATADIGHCHLL